jgi:hypothetical protein
VEGRAFADVKFTSSRPRIYLATLHVTDIDGTSHSAVTLVHVFDPTALDARLQAVWNSFPVQLVDARNIDQSMMSIRLVEVGFGGAQYEMLRPRDGRMFSFAVWFQLDFDGLWRLRRF